MSHFGILFVILLVIFGTGFGLGYYFGSRVVAKFKQELQSIETDVRGFVAPYAQSVADRLKAIAAKL